MGELCLSSCAVSVAIAGHGRPCDRRVAILTAAWLTAGRAGRSLSLA